ncbi:MAG: hypothetical protein WB625_14780, partial [Candidatus Sulfotelmatobacter sp.]
FGDSPEFFFLTTDILIMRLTLASPLAWRNDSKAVELRILFTGRRRHRGVMLFEIAARNCRRYNDAR